MSATRETCACPSCLNSGGWLESQTSLDWVIWCEVENKWVHYTNEQYGKVLQRLAIKEKNEQRKIKSRAKAYLRECRIHNLKWKIRCNKDRLRKLVRKMYKDL